KLVRRAAGSSASGRLELLEATGGRERRGRLGADPPGMVVARPAGHRAGTRFAQSRGAGPHQPPRPRRGKLALALHRRDAGGARVPGPEELDEGRKPAPPLGLELFTTVPNRVY